MTLVSNSYNDLAKAIKELNKMKNDYIINTLKSESNENSCLDSLTEVLHKINLKSYIPILKKEGTYDKNNRDDKYVMLGSGELFAAKVFKVPIQQSGDLAHQCPLNLFKREVFTVSGFNHPVIIKYIGYNPYSLIEKLENSKYANTIMLTLIIEYKENGNLESVIATEKLKNDQTTKLKIIIGIASGIKAFHKSNVVHRDPKRDNIVLDKNNEPVIYDFGCSRQYSDMVDNNITGTIGSLIYIAPELFVDLIKACWNTPFLERPDPDTVYYQLLNAV